MVRTRYREMTPSSSDNDRGVLYIAFGDPYRAEAEHSARTLKAHCPSISTQPRILHWRRVHERHDWLRRFSTRARPYRF